MSRHRARRPEVRSTLPAAWWTDPGYAAPVRTRIRALLSEGLTADAIAAQVGVCRRTVHRHRAAIRAGR
jgi:DNA-binding NarL/FixJ family response regulator